MDTCDECEAAQPRSVPVEELTEVPRPDGTMLRLCRDCYERGEYAVEAEAEAEA